MNAHDNKCKHILHFNNLLYQVSLKYANLIHMRKIECFCTCTLAVWWFKPFLNVALRDRYILIYLAVYGPEIIDGFGLETEKSKIKTKAVCSLGRTNYGSLRNVQPPTVDPQNWGLLCKWYMSI